MKKIFLRAGILFALIAVALGAFAAHGLKAHLSPERLEIFQTGVRYQFYHAFALLFLGLLADRYENPLNRWAGWLFLAGVLCFSGSLYVLAVRDWLSLSVAWLGPVTPLGGVLFIGGWTALFLSTFRQDFS